MDASSIKKETMIDVAREDVELTPNNSNINFLKEGERSSVFCCKALLTSRMSDI
jgi:hypothetical protein